LTYIIIIAILFIKGGGLNMTTTVVTTKGQIVIPSKIRQHYRIRKGTRICFIEQGENLILRPITEEYVDRLKGTLPTRGKAIKALLEDKKKEREL
jgi:AbrB family looped-hinge helix DNA binding protein